MPTRMKMLVAATLVLAIAVDAEGPKDAMTEPVSKTELIRLIQGTPIDSPNQSTLMGRALASHLINVAYDQYTSLWRRNPNGAYTNLLRGSAAAEYWLYCAHPSSTMHLSAKQSGDLFGACPRNS